MQKRMPEAQRGPSHRDELGYFSRRLPFRNTTYALDSTPGGLRPPGCDRSTDYIGRDNGHDSSSACTLAGTDYSGI